MTLQEPTLSSASWYAGCSVLRVLLRLRSMPGMVPFEKQYQSLREFGVETFSSVLRLVLYFIATSTTQKDGVLEEV